jgi:tetratricopeptide (TPR) repeat protein
MRQHSCFLLIIGTLLSAQLVQAQSELNLISDLKAQLKTSLADTSRVKLLLELGRSYTMNPGELAKDLDTALVLVRHAHSLSRFLGYEKGRGNAFLVGAQAFREKGNTVQARKFGQTAINLFAKNQNLAELAAAHMELGNTYGNSKGELVEKIRHYEAALPLFHQVGYREREATTLKQLADFNKILQNNPQSIKQLEQALHIYQSIDFRDLQGVYDLLGDVNGQIGNYNEALKYGLLAVKTAELRKDTTLQLCTIY